MVTLTFGYRLQAKMFYHDPPALEIEHEACAGLSSALEGDFSEPPLL